ncbi:hypothetical protein KP509_22G049700 [Ceratopteris richardii]|uniref:Protein kinase domain-containing protein n=1 Tax=Ceratopteris richardii TaxID=49495 RepID=A0A8T2S5Y8_CERRI|nr:hypothetical protein KP509_22G049700 [Ceratopteris richardii]
MNSRRDSLTRTTSLTTLDMDLFLFCVVSLLVFLLLGHCSADLNQDASGLLAFKKSVDANDRLDWGSSSNPCEWEGIKCEGPPLLKSLRVVEVRTPGTPLYGSIPSGTLSLLSELRVISLRANHLSGRFPSDLSNCSFLRSMYLQYNYLSGPLPDFSSWPNLVHVDLSFNNFSGSIPSTLGNLTRLVTLYLKNNSLTGSLPLINIDSLNGFSVANNDLEGPVPDTQMYRRFNEDSFVGNGLCGLSLQSCDKKSPGNVQVPQNIVGSHHRGLSKGAIVGIIAALIAVCLCLVFLCLFAFRKGISKDNKSGKPASNGAGPVAHGDPRATYAPALEMNSEYKKLVFLDGVEHSFDLEELLRASAEVLGKGSIGTSYKAALDSGLIVAVKRLRDITTERREFEAHMSNISRIKHEHLLPFIAYFYSREEKLVVTEYMPNGSLSTLLHGKHLLCLLEAAFLQTLTGMWLICFTYSSNLLSNVRECNVLKQTATITVHLLNSF